MTTYFWHKVYYPINYFRFNYINIPIISRAGIILGRFFPLYSTSSTYISIKKKKIFKGCVKMKLCWTNEKVS